MENKYTEWPSSQRLKKAEYYIYGIKYSKEEHKERIRQKTGLPWYKKPAPKGMTHRN